MFFFKSHENFSPVWSRYVNTHSREANEPSTQLHCDCSASLYFRQQVAPIMLFLLNIRFTCRRFFFFIIYYSHRQTHDRVLLPSLSRFKLKLTKLFFFFMRTEKNASVLCAAAFFLLLRETFSSFYVSGKRIWALGFFLSHPAGEISKRNSLRSDGLLIILKT